LIKPTTFGSGYKLYYSEVIFTSGIEIRAAGKGIHVFPSPALKGKIGSKTGLFGPNSGSMSEFAQGDLKG
jgi:hypothetical protein